MKDSLRDLNITELSTMEEDSGLDIMYLNKHRHSSSTSSSAPERENDGFNKRKLRITMQDYPRKSGQILSGQYGINLLLLGFAFMLGVSYHGHSIKEKHLVSYITTLMLMQLLWMLWYIVRKDRQKHALPEKDAHAGTSWLRGGLTILAMLSLIMDAFRIGKYVGYKACLSSALVVYPVVHAIHTISQVYFLWFHIKDVIKTFETFERFGVIHAVFTNLLLWCSGAMTESQNVLDAHKKRLSALGFMNYTYESHEPYCNCTTKACSMFSNSLYYLYPFNIEYHIIVSAMLFVMWKNIGRTIEHHQHHIKKKPVAKTAGLVAGPILGFVALAGTIGVLVVYLIQVEATLETRTWAIHMFYQHGIVLMGSMFIASTLGLIIYRTDSWPQDSSKNPSRQLDKELLCGSAIGSWIMSWCGVVAAVASHSEPSYRWTNLAYSLLLVLEKYFQNLFIVESLYLKQEDEEEGSAREVEEGVERSGEAGMSSSRIFSVTSSSTQVPPYDGIINQAFVTQEKMCISLDGSQVKNSHLYQYQCQTPQDSPPLPAVSRTAAALNRKRQILRNIAVFLVLCNSALWLLPAFGCRPQYDNGLEQETFGFAIWTMVLNFAMPLNLFYRMHSVASLFEVFCHV
ncbi:hypothetical protein AGOR_G00183910 [Albula goreensis]|uniref:Otopetrin 1 n=1 Tax=Albula goreensis TaxID=1534307 RepID=A0A8T3CWA8_9TELE|nr:hypothetical protein AGOR_G00183910 [Albula goreensis]